MLSLPAVNADLNQSIPPSFNTNLYQLQTALPLFMESETAICGKMQFHDIIFCLIDRVKQPSYYKW